MPGIGTDQRARAPPKADGTTQADTWAAWVAPAAAARRSPTRRFQNDLVHRPAAAADQRRYPDPESVIRPEPRRSRDGTARTRLPPSKIRPPPRHSGTPAAITPAPARRRPEVRPSVGRIAGAPRPPRAGGPSPFPAPSHERFQASPRQPHTGGPGPSAGPTIRTTAGAAATPSPHVPSRSWCRPNADRGALRRGIPRWPPGQHPLGAGPAPTARWLPPHPLGGGPPITPQLSAPTLICRSGRGSAARTGPAHAPDTCRKRAWWTRPGGC